MVDFAGADALKSFPILQLAAGVLVIIIGVYMTLRAARDNKRDGHIAPQGHDPYGFVVFSNQALTYLSLMVEHGRRNGAMLDAVHAEQIKTNARLSEMKDSHASEMDRLRDVIEERARPRR